MKNICLLTLWASLLALSLFSQAKSLKIITLSPHATELAYEAGLGENLVAVSAHSDFPPAANKLEQVADYKQINIEKIIALQPDLVIAWKGGNAQKALDKLKALGIKIIYSAPKTLLEIADDIERLGQYARNANIAKKQAENLRFKIRQFEKKYKNKTRVTYFYQLSNFPLMTNNESQWPQPIFSLCGGENIFANSPAAYPQINIEQILIRKPEIIVSTNSLATHAYWKKWQNHIPAVKNNAILIIDGTSLGRPTSRALIAAKQICDFFDTIRSHKILD